MSVTLTDEAAEALDGALYETGFEPLGNSEGGRVDWWTRRGSERHQVIRVAVARSDMGFLLVTVEWPTLSPSGVLRSSLTLTVPTTSQSRDNVVDAVSAVMVRLLEVFRDVLTGTGVASAREDSGG